MNNENLKIVFFDCGNVLGSDVDMVSTLVEIEPNVSSRKDEIKLVYKK